MSNFLMMVYGIPFVISVAVALALGALCWLVELLIRRRIGVYAGYAAMILVALYTVHILYRDFTDCSGSFGWPVLFPQCEWSIVSRLLVVCLTMITMPLLLLSEIKLSRWSLNRAQLTP